METLRGEKNSALPDFRDPNFSQALDANLGAIKSGSGLLGPLTPDLESQIIFDVADQTLGPIAPLTTEPRPTQQAAPTAEPPVPQTPVTLPQGPPAPPPKSLFERGSDPGFPGTGRDGASAEPITIEQFVQQQEAVESKRIQNLVDFVGPELALNIMATQGNRIA